MVHALTQIHRILAPHGVVADILPDRRVHGPTRHAGRPRVYVGSSRWCGPIGVLQKTAKKVADHRAADAAVKQVLRRGLFALQAADTFEFRYYFRTLAHLDDHLATRWIETSLPLPTRRRLLTGLHGHPTFQILVVEPTQLNVLVKARTAQQGIGRFRVTNKD